MQEAIDELDEIQRLLGIGQTDEAYRRVIALRRWLSKRSAESDQQRASSVVYRTTKE